MASTCSTTKAGVLTGGCLRAREWPGKMSVKGTPAACSSRKRLSHFLTQPLRKGDIVKSLRLMRIIADLSALGGCSDILLKKLKSITNAPTPCTGQHYSHRKSALTGNTATTTTNSSPQASHLRFYEGPWVFYLSVP